MLSRVADPSKRQGVVRGEVHERHREGQSEFCLGCVILLVHIVHLFCKGSICLYTPSSAVISASSFYRTLHVQTQKEMILEFRIPLPITVSDFQVAQLAMVISAQEKVTGGGEGILVLKNEPYASTLTLILVVLITLTAIWA